MNTVTTTDLEKRLHSNLNLQYLKIEDVSDGCGDKFHITAAGKAFEGKTLLQQHRLVNETLREEMKSIHALSLKTMTPEKFEEWQKNGN